MNEEGDCNLVAAERGKEWPGNNRLIGSNYPPSPEDPRGFIALSNCVPGGILSPVDTSEESLSLVVIKKLIE